MSKIIGNTTTTPMAIPDWNQTDATKADYIKNKPEILTETDVKQIIAETGGGSGGTTTITVQADWAENNADSSAYIKNKPTDLATTTYVDGEINDLDGRIDTLESQIAELLYVPIAFSSFTNNVGAKEIGSIVRSVTLSWGINKTPTTLTLDGQSIDVNSTSKTISDLAITYENNKTWKLVATDEKNSVEKTTTITFCNAIYYGVGTQENEFTGGFVTSLTMRLQTGKAYDFTVNPNDQYIYYAVPKSRGTVTFKVGGFEGGFEAPEIVSVTNSAQYTEDYYVYRSTNKITGSTSVDVT